MTSQPLGPAGEAPLDAATLQALLRGVGTEMVLVGGQVLAFWMDRYGIAPQGATISNDGDALGRLDQAERIACDLRAILVRPSDRAMTSLVAQIRIPVGAQGQVRNIDVLQLLFSVGGLRKSREFTDAVWRDSVEMEWQPGHHLRVMHPLHVLESRIHNAVGLLGDKGPHVLTQARWAIEVARAAMLRVLAQPGEQVRLGVMLQQVYRLARSRAGRQLMREHGIEPLLAVHVEQIRAGAPELGRQLAGVERAIALRARGVGDPLALRGSSASESMR